MEMPAIDELTTELNISVEHLESCKRETYQRTFRLWMPMVHDFNAIPEDEDMQQLATEVLPVDELLDRVMLRRVRVSAVERSILFLLFNFLYCACLIMQRSLSDSYELESALKVRGDKRNPCHLTVYHPISYPSSPTETSHRAPPFSNHNRRFKSTPGASSFPRV